MTSFADAFEPLCCVAEEVLKDPHGIGMEFTRAVAAGRSQYIAQPGARIDVHNGIVIGHGLRGVARAGSFVIDLSGGRGMIDAQDSVVVGTNVRVLSRGNVRVKGRGARVTVAGARTLRANTRTSFTSACQAASSSANPRMSKPRVSKRKQPRAAP